MNRKNINRGYKQLRVWQDAISLYVLATKIFSDFPFELKKVAGNTIDAAHSISRNIAEGYCCRSLKEYLNHLNIAMGSCGEFHSCYFSCMQANQITKEQYEEIDQLHYKVENELLRLVKSLAKKQQDEWMETI
ncbi:MAG: four helix bundle protein [bacterium]